MACPTPKKKRMYRHIRNSYLESGKSKEKAEEIAARTVKKKVGYLHLAYLSVMVKTR